MALFKTFSDVKPHIGAANVNNDLSTIESYLYAAADSYMVPVLGSATWDALVEAYDESSLSAAQVKIIKPAQRALANFAYLLYAEDGGVILNDAGMGQVNNGEMKPLFQWQVRDFKRNRLTIAWDAMRVLLETLEANKNDFEDWWDSEERKSMWELVIWNSRTWNKYRKVNGQGTLMALAPAVRTWMNNVLRSNLSDDLYEIFVKYLRGDDLTGTGETGTELAKLIPYVERALVFGSLGQACMDLPVQIDAKGVFIDETDKGLTNDEKRLKLQREEANRLMQSMVQQERIAVGKLRRYLDNNASTEKYVGYYNSDLYQQTLSGPLEDLHIGPTFMM